MHRAAGLAPGNQGANAHVAERNTAALNSFQYPSEMTSGLRSVTLMAVCESMAYAGPVIPAAHFSASAMVLSGLSRCGKMEKSTSPSVLSSPPARGFLLAKRFPMRGVSTKLPALSPT